MRPARTAHPAGSTAGSFGRRQREATVNATKSVTATCSLGKKVLGGGADTTGSTKVAVRSSATDTSVTASGYETSNDNRNWTVTTWVICAIAN